MPGKKTAPKQVARQVAPAGNESVRRLARAMPAGLMMYDSAAQLQAPPHIQYLNRVLVDFMAAVRRGEDPRVLVAFPPRHGKTTLAGNYFPAWAMGNWPELRFGYLAYNQGFADTQGGKVRDILRGHGRSGSRLFDVDISDDTAAKGLWKTDEGGLFLASGRGGMVTGYGFDVLLWDDLVKNAEEARSVAVMDAAWEWLMSTARTRVQPGGGALGIGTRWSKRDPIGRLIEAQKAPDWEGDVFTVINVPALAVENEQDVIGRAPGTALAPTWGWTAERLRKLKATIGSIWFAALYQGNPTPDEGIIFNRADFRYFTEEGEGKHRTYALLDDPMTGAERRFAARDCHLVAFMDPAATEGDLSAYTAITVWAITPENDLLLVDVLRQKVETTKHAAFMDSARARWGDDLLFVVEKGAYGFHMIQHERLKGKNIRSVRAETDKVARARIAEARYTVHKVFHHRQAPWLSTFESELLEFPLGQYKDLVDTTAYACAWTAYGEAYSDTEDGASLTDIMNRLM